MKPGSDLTNLKNINIFQKYLFDKVRDIGDSEYFHYVLKYVPVFRHGLSRFSPHCTRGCLFYEHKELLITAIIPK